MLFFWKNLELFLPVAVSWTLFEVIAGDTNWFFALLFTDFPC
jgi:hypothetical protein